MGTENTAQTTTPTGDNPTTTGADVVTTGAQGLGATTTQTEGGQTTAEQTQQQITQDQKPEADKPAAGAPEKYDIKAPEGVAMDETGMEAFAGFARDQGLTNEAAQAFLDKLGPVMTQRHTDQIAAVQQQWFDASKNDKEFGGPQFDQNLAIAQRALDKFGSPELTQFLVDSGLGKHPEIIRAFHKVGKAISEDSLVTGQGSGAPQKTMAQRMYPDMNP
jgi:hypothetical protein